MEIQSIPQFLGLIARLRKNYGSSVPARFIFRGHSNHKDYALLPGIFRCEKQEDSTTRRVFSQYEYKILFDFISEACSYEKDLKPNLDFVPWLEIAQHFCVPTRLLDFTENPLVALYFACNGAKNEDASVWVVNETIYKQKFYGVQYEITPACSDSIVAKIVSMEICNPDGKVHDKSDRYYQVPWIYKPFYRDGRMNSQSSIFMIWAAKQDELTAFMNPENYMKDVMEPDNRAEGILCPIMIRADKKKELLQQLEECGITEKFIYPGLDGIGKYIRSQYTINYDQ